MTDMHPLICGDCDTCMSKLNSILFTTSEDGIADEAREDWNTAKQALDHLYDTYYPEYITLQLIKYIADKKEETT